MTPPEPLESGLAALTPDPQNAMKHGRRNVDAIVSALQEVGAARSIVIDESGIILAGNATVEAAAEAGITKVQVVDVDGRTLVAVRRRDLTPAQKARLALFDNRTSQLADGWNVDVLRQLEAAGVQLGDLWTPDELAALLGSDPAAGLTDPDDIPEPRSTDIVLGDMFELGPHRLLCGSSTNGDDVARVLADAVPGLMVTDPPYGVNYDPTWRVRAGLSEATGKLGKVLNDDQADWSPAWALFPGDVAYVWHAALKAPIVQASLEVNAFQMRAQIVWAKDRFALSRGDYHWQHEACLYGVRKGRRSHRSKDRTQSTLWRIATPPAWLEEDIPLDSTVWEIPSREDDGHGHGTQKPVECMARAMRNHDIAEVYEPFSGSGTSLIAGQTLGRRVYAIELNPVYVQLAIDRWEAFTGLKAQKVGEAVRR